MSEVIIVADVGPALGCLALRNEAGQGPVSHKLHPYPLGTEERFLWLLWCHFISGCNSKAITYKLTWGSQLVADKARLGSPPVLLPLWHTQ